MQRIIRPIATSIALVSLSAGAFAADEEKAADAKVNEKCPITGKAVLPDCTLKYEDNTYAFCSVDCCKQFNKERKSSLYHKIGGKVAINATVDAFYKKVLADDRVNHFFEDVNMRRQHNKQKAFISAALGSPVPWTGKDMRKAHANLELTETDFGVIAGHLQKTLEELEVDEKLIKEVMTVVGSTKDAVLNRPKKSA